MRTSKKYNQIEETEHRVDVRFDAETWEILEKLSATDIYALRAAFVDAYEAGWRAGRDGNRERLTGRNINTDEEMPAARRRRRARR